MRGLESYLQRKDRERRMQEDKALRQKEVFTDGSKYKKGGTKKSERPHLSTEERSRKNVSKDYKHKFVL